MINWEKLAKPNIMRIPAYIPGKPSEEVEREYGLTDVLKLASNENVLGPSPKAMAAVTKKVGAISVYPDADFTSLRQAIGMRYGFAPGQVIVGNGSDEIIRLVAESLLGPGDEAVICEPTFGEYIYAVNLVGAEPVVVRSQHGQDLRAILAAVTDRTRVVFICNPNNPTGTYIGKKELEAFLAALPEGVLVLYDAAYREYAEADDYPEGFDYVRRGAPILTTRTFSKIYGLAGLRIGYGIGPPDLISLLYRVKEPFNVNLLGQAAALDALDDGEHVRRSLEMNASGKKQIYRGIEALGLEYLPSQANFVLVDLHRDEKEIYQRLLHLGVIVRPAGFFGLPGRIRVTIGTSEQNQRFLSALATALADASE